MLIDMYITASILTFTWYTTGFYGSLYTAHKYLTCNAIDNLYQSRMSFKWLIFGDLTFFLIVLKKWEAMVLIIIMLTFSMTLNNCDLTDLGYIGNQYTLANNIAIKLPY